MNLVLILLAVFARGCTGLHDGWDRTSYPVEELTSGLEVGPDDTLWGRAFRVNFKTSRRDFAASSGSVYVTFYGRRATSDTMLLQEGFANGALDSVTLQLTREIGELEKVRLQTNSTDGWLLDSMWIDVGATT